jgi:ubiquinone/menaquinone biosynthesis C-methylase UbiE
MPGTKVPAETALAARKKFLRFQTTMRALRKVIALPHTTITQPAGARVTWWEVPRASRTKDAADPGFEICILQSSAERLRVRRISVAQNWDPVAYGREGAFVHQLAGGVVEWLDAKPGERILDLGCGDGQLTARIAALGANVTGVDASAAMVEAARSRGVDAEQAPAEKLPFPAAAFDAVFSNAALHWVRGQDAMMSEVHRVLKHGGRFVAEMGGHGNIAAIRAAFMTVLARHGFGDREDGVNYYPTPEAYRSQLEKHGFAIERTELIPRPTPLAEGGMAGWLKTFRRGVLDALPAEQRGSIVEETCALLEPALRDEDGNWVADYVRLRFAARAR